MAVSNEIPIIVQPTVQAPLGGIVMVPEHNEDDGLWNRIQAEVRLEAERIQAEAQLISQEIQIAAAREAVRIETEEYDRLRERSDRFQAAIIASEAYEPEPVWIRIHVEGIQKAIWRRVVANREYERIQIEANREADRIQNESMSEAERIQTQIIIDGMRAQMATIIVDDHESDGDDEGSDDEGSDDGSDEDN